jgi:hypothetical protein
LRFRSSHRSREKSDHLKRRLFNLAAAVSLVLCVTTALLWACGKSWFSPPIPGRQHFVGRWFYRVSDSRSIGCIRLEVYHDSPVPDVGPPLAKDLSYTPEALAWYDRLPTGIHLRTFGFGYDHDTYFERNATRSMVAMGRYLSVGIPFWAAGVMGLMPLAFAPVIWRRRRARIRIGRGLCPVCGYDLRASPIAARSAGRKPSRNRRMERSRCAASFARGETRFTQFVF